MALVMQILCMMHMLIGIAQSKLQSYIFIINTLQSQNNVLGPGFGILLPYFLVHNKPLHIICKVFFRPQISAENLIPLHWMHPTFGKNQKVCVSQCCHLVLLVQCEHGCILPDQRPGFSIIFQLNAVLLFD